MNVGAAAEGVNKWGQTLLAQQDVDDTNGLPLRGRGLTPFVHTFIDRANRRFRGP
jgi:hypothetical protein